MPAQSPKSPVHECTFADYPLATFTRMGNSPAPCCPPDSHGAAEPGYIENEGIIETWDSLDVYVVRPTHPAARAVVVASDVFGYDSGHTRAVCDRISRELQCIVACPDLFHGTPIATSAVEDTAWTSIPWRAAGAVQMLRRLRQYRWNNKDGTPGNVRTDLELGIVRRLQEVEGILSVGLLGFCWGGWLVMHGASINCVRAAAGCHPSPDKLCWLLGEDLEKVLNHVQCPVLLCPASNVSLS